MGSKLYGKEVLIKCSTGLTCDSSEILVTGDISGKGVISNYHSHGLNILKLKLPTYNSKITIYNNYT